jgi:hypothetical protein
MEEAEKGEEEIGVAPVSDRRSAGEGSRGLVRDRTGEGP